MAKPKKLSGFTDRNAAHAELETVLAAGTYPQAECREDLDNDTEPYQVWSAPDPRSRGGAGAE